MRDLQIKNKETLLVTLVALTAPKTRDWQMPCYLVAGDCKAVNSATGLEQRSCELEELSTVVAKGKIPTHDRSQHYEYTCKHGLCNDFTEHVIARCGPSTFTLHCVEG